MATVRVIVTEDAVGKAAREKKGGRVIANVVTSTGLKRGTIQPSLADAVLGAFNKALDEVGL